MHTYKLTLFQFSEIEFKAPENLSLQDVDIVQVKHDHNYIHILLCVMTLNCSNRTLLIASVIF